MDSIRIQNFKSVKDSGDIRLAPITIVVGRNSCGKSSLLRVLPLLRQSIETPTNDSILWYGKDVDIGDFETALTKGLNADNDSIIFSFGLQFEWRRRRRNSTGSKLTITKESQKARIELLINKNSIVGYRISLDGTSIEYAQAGNEHCSVRLNGHEVPYLTNVNDPRTRSTFLPTPYVNPRLNTNLRSAYGELANNVLYPLADADIIDTYYVSFNEALTVFSIVEPTQENGEIIKRALSSTVNFDVFLKQASEIKIKSEANPNPDDIPYILFIPVIQSIISRVNKALEQDLVSVSYIAPVRASANRYYRVQGSDVSSVAPDGTNAPMILFNMSINEKKEFENWSRENFGFWFAVKGSTALTSIVVSDGTTNDINMTDVGFGYSQILPILLSLWNSERTKQNQAYHKGPLQIVIEQPELHLHPAMQAKLVAAFCKIATKQLPFGLKIKFLIETHSETIINVIGQMIADKKFSAEDANIVICNKKDGISYFQETTFTEDGFLNEWPIGFFSPDYL